MRYVCFLVLLLSILVIPAKAADYTAPDPPSDVMDLLPAEKENFGKGLWQVISRAFAKMQPELVEACGVCTGIVGIVMLSSILHGISEKNAKLLDLFASLVIGILLLTQTKSLVNLGVDTVRRLRDYGKLLLPVMTASLAGQGGVTTSASLYTITMVFDTVFCSGIANLLIPLIYAFLALSIGSAAIGEEILEKIKGFVKWLMTWILKTSLYIFTGYLGITGVVSGTTDASALKATKLTISGMVPVVGSILSDASEAVLVGAGLVKGAVGIYGLLAMIAIWIIPFLTIGAQYLFLKLTSAICSTFSAPKAAGLIDDFSKAMGFLLALTGAVCMFLLISTVCFMKGVSV